MTGRPATLSLMWLKRGLVGQHGMQVIQNFFLRLFCMAVTQDLSPQYHAIYPEHVEEIAEPRAGVKTEIGSGVITFPEAHPSPSPLYSINSYLTPIEH